MGAIEDAWRWEGDQQVDDLSSLTGGVLIAADDLRDVFARAEAAEARVANLKELSLRRKERINEVEAKNESLCSSLEAAEARVAELETERDTAVRMKRVAQAHEGSLEVYLERAERLAEAVHKLRQDERTRADDETLLELRRIEVDATLEAFRSPEPQPAAESEPHPDSARLDWWIGKCHVSREHALVLQVRDDTAIVWDQYNGLAMVGEGEDARAALDDAMERDSAREG